VPITYTPMSTTPIATGTVPFASLKANAWNEVDVATQLLPPGLYVVSASVVGSVSLSTIDDVVPGGATPSVLTIVAGSSTQSLLNPFPAFVYSDKDAGFPTAYFWLDVSFSPMY
jgi:hypothetical protein